MSAGARKTFFCSVIQAARNAQLFIDKTKYCRILEKYKLSSPQERITNMPGLGLSCSPSLSLSLGHRQRQCHRLSQRPALTLEQRQEQRLKQTQEHLLWSNHHLMNFLRFASFVCSRQFVPGATCIECNHALS